MSLDTYANLKTEIANHLERSDLTSDIDTFIDLAEERHRADVRIREMVSRSSLTINARYVNLPSDLLQPISLRILTDPVTVLNAVSPHEMTRIRVESTGKPTSYCISGSEIEFDKAPDSSYSGEIRYYAEQTALSDANTTNDILTRAPSLYLYGALLAAEPFLMNDARIQTWAALYDAARDGINTMDRKRSGPLVSKVVGATP